MAGCGSLSFRVALFSLNWSFRMALFLGKTMKWHIPIRNKINDLYFEFSAHIEAYKEAYDIRNKKSRKEFQMTDYEQKTKENVCMIPMH